MWPYILNKVEFSFAYHSFKWTNSAKGNAGVTVTILGLRNFNNENKYLFENDFKKSVKNINAYLIDAPNVFVRRLTTNINGFPPLVRGSMPTDGGHFEISEQERKNLLDNYPKSEIFIKKLMSGGDFMKGTYRWCLWIKDEDIRLAKSIPLIVEKMESVKQFRLKSKAPTTVEYAKYYNRFRQISYKETDCIVVPLTSSVRRKYIPFGFEGKNTVMTNSAGVIYDADLWLFGILSSKIHMVWVSVTCGRLKTDYRYSSHLSYNTFPFPEISKVKKANIEENVYAVLEEREKHPEKTMAELYDPDKMPKGLRQAHKDLDEAVERCYRLRPFQNDTERLEYLFKEYEKMVAKDTLFQKQKKTRRKKK